MNTSRLKLRNLKSWTKALGTVLQYSYFSVISWILLKQCSVIEIFLQFSLPHPIQSWNSEKNSGYTRPTLFVGWGEGLDLCELENAPETQKCPKTFVYDCSTTDIIHHVAKTPDIQEVQQSADNITAEEESGATQLKSRKKRSTQNSMFSAAGFTSKSDRITITEVMRQSKVESSSWKSQ